MKAPRPFAVLFDLDGTLIDTVGLLLECVRHTFEGRTPAPTDDEWIAGIGTPLRKQFAAYTSTNEEIEELALRYRNYQRIHHDRMTNPFPGVISVLEALQKSGRPMGTVTSKSNEMMDRALTWTGLDRFMSVNIGADSCHRHKPDPFPVHLALEKLGYSPDEAIFVGDSPHDIASGNAAGVASIAVLWGPFTREQLEPYHPTRFVDRVEDLPRVIAELESQR